MLDHPDLGKVVQKCRLLLSGCLPFLFLSVFVHEYQSPSRSVHVYICLSDCLSLQNWGIVCNALNGFEDLIGPSVTTGCIYVSSIKRVNGMDWLLSSSCFLVLQVHLVTCSAFLSSANKFEFLDLGYVSSAVRTWDKWRVDIHSPTEMAKGWHYW